MGGSDLDKIQKKAFFSQENVPKSASHFASFLSKIDLFNCILGSIYERLGDLGAGGGLLVCCLYCYILHR